jgi:ribosomal protein S18 acetylase RimI-like enzyme
MPLAFTIQPANWRDLFPLQQLEQACFQTDAWPLIELLAALTFPGVVRLKAVIGVKMAGFIAGDKRRTEGVGWILTLGVHPNYRRQGIAQTLLDDCEKQMKMPLVKLSVRRSNLGAIALYEKLGYSQVTVWKKYYFDGEDGLVMEKRMSH